MKKQATDWSKEERAPTAKEMLQDKLEALAEPGVSVEMSREEANSIGLFEEEGVSLKDAEEAVVHHNVILGFPNIPDESIKNDLSQLD